MIYNGATKKFELHSESPPERLIFRIIRTKYLTETRDGQKFNRIKTSTEKQVKFFTYIPTESVSIVGSWNEGKYAHMLERNAARKMEWVFDFKRNMIEEGSYLIYFIVETRREE